MASISGAIFYVFIFLTVYIQVFLLVTFLENRKKIVIRKGPTKLSRYRGVTIIVPCWNEEKTIYHTVRSILDLNYPQNKLKIILVDDGSTDGTWNAIKKFDKYSNIKVFKKENGGKHTALNLGLENTDTPFVGCLDADSFADKESLVRIMSYFEVDEEVMAVAPSLIVHNSKTFVQNAQKVEYYMSVYIKKMLGTIGAIHVTPGPLTIFRKKVFDDLGPYRSAHTTEDMEIAYRMQKNHYKIEHCNDAYVYTNTPSTIKTLFKQRLRWIYGFINNTIDYRDVIWKKKYGDFSFFTLPAGVLAIFSVSYAFGKVVYSAIDFIYSKILKFQTVGFQPNHVTNNFDLFFINTQSFIFIVMIIYALLVFSIIMGRRMVEGKWNLSFDIIYYISIFSVIAPFWLLKAIFNTVTSKKPAWR